MKICHVITKSELGGAQTWVKNLAELFCDFEHVLIVSDEGWLTEQSIFSEVHVIPGISKLHSPSAFVCLLRRVKIINPDVIIASSANAGIYSRLLKLFIKTKIVYVSHGWSCIYNGGGLQKIFMLVEHALSKLSDKVICVSKSDYDNARTLIGIEESKLTLINNKVPVPSGKIQVSDTLNPNCFNVLYLARLVHPKRLDLLVDCARALNDISFHVVGDGPEMEELKRTSPSNVTYHGGIDSFSDFFSFNLFCLFSDSEGMPMSALEAGASGLPMVLSNVGGCTELITNNGFLVDNESQVVIETVRKAIENINDLKINAEGIKCNFTLSSSRLDYLKVLSNS